MRLAGLSPAASLTKYFALLSMSTSCKGFPIGVAKVAGIALNSDGHGELAIYIGVGIGGDEIVERSEVPAAGPIVEEKGDVLPVAIGIAEKGVGDDPGKSGAGVGGTIVADGADAAENCDEARPSVLLILARRGDSEGLACVLLVESTESVAFSDTIVAGYETVAVPGLDARKVRRRQEQKKLLWASRYTAHLSWCPAKEKRTMPPG